jgi:hypothetical protein
MWKLPSIHQFGKRNYSFCFKGSYYDYAIRELSVFRKHYLDGHALPQSASRAEMEYNHTSAWIIFLYETTGTSGQDMGLPLWCTYDAITTTRVFCVGTFECKLKWEENECTRWSCSKPGYWWCKSQIHSKKGLIKFIKWKLLKRVTNPNVDQNEHN